MLKIKIEIDKKSSLFSKVKSFFGITQKSVDKEIILALDEIYNRSQMAVPTSVVGGVNLRATAYKDYQKKEVGYASVLAAYYEFGTGAYVDIEPGLESYAMTFFVDGKGTIKPQPFLFPAFYSVGKEFSSNVMKAINSNWNK